MLFMMDNEWGEPNQPNIIWYFDVTMVTFWMTILMNKQTKIDMDDG